MAEVALTSWNSEVYEPSDDTFALVDALAQEQSRIMQPHPPRVIVEIGCGSGFVICSAAFALRSARPDACAGSPAPPGHALLAVDVSAAALAATSETLAAHRVSGVELVQCDLLGPLAARLRGCVDLLLFNPPYVPTPDDEVARGGIAATWAGGHRGRRVIDRVLPQLPELLAPGGHCLIVTVAENDPEDIIRQMASRGLAGSVVLARGADEEALRIVLLRKAPAGG